ncbi:Ldh family oxidoreductase [Erwiniaceae bacterium BAC15a-03b]|uniref:Ldh family oxidoreductase n=1 Tax=Winslowiella arboricola TaxID=2978220 RepID=A0A9J6PKI2_9GAMM|nr:Ldh family oxidoreductase [Winslowiella arboricola]MCU5772352.1 Ldh family oxidoreductase [Winslowiella arboricola]MCU5776216.1 Ldh family oxidoreductase [Winslowiella arboricola]
MKKPLLFPAELLLQQTETILRGWGIAADAAQQTAKLIIETDLLGIDSHGISMLPHYDRLLRDAQWHPTGETRLLSETPTTAVLDGGHALGHATAQRAIELAVDKSEQSGLGCVVVRNANHFGAAGLYARYAAARGKIALVTSTTRSRMLVPSRAAMPVLGTNPIAFAAPAGRNEDFALDMATTTVAANKIKVYDYQEKDLPAGWVVDARGEAVTSSREGMITVYEQPEGGLTPLGGLEQNGGHKGYGLAMMAQILAGTLAGSAFAATRPAGEIPDIGHFFLAINPTAFGPLAQFEQGLDEVIDTLHATPASDPTAPVLVAGEPENHTRRQRVEYGVPLPDSLLQKLRDICQQRDFSDLLTPYASHSSG